MKKNALLKLGFEIEKGPLQLFQLLSKRFDLFFEFRNRLVLHLIARGEGFVAGVALGALFRRAGEEMGVARFLPARLSRKEGYIPPFLERLQGLLDLFELLKGMESLRAAADFADRLRSPQHQHTENRRFPLNEVGALEKEL